MRIALLISLLTFLVPLQANAGEPENQVAVATVDGQRLVVQQGSGPCALGSKEVQHKVGLDRSSNAGVPALESYAQEGRLLSRIVILDLACNRTQTFREYGILVNGWVPKLAEAMQLGYLDLSDLRRGIGDPNWGSWNLRTNTWDPAPCCSTPAHSIIQIKEQQMLQAAIPPTVLGSIWMLVRTPVVMWVYAAIVTVCGLMAFVRGRRGVSLVVHGAIVLPMKALFIALALACVASIAALASLLQSGGMSLFVHKIRDRMMVSWRK